MDINKYRVVLLSLKEKYTIGGGGALPQAILEFIETSRKTSAFFLQEKNPSFFISEAPLYQGITLQGSLAPFGFGKVHYTLSGDAAGKIVFKGPYEDVRKYMESEQKGFAKFEPPSPSKIESIHGQTVTEAVWKVNNLPATPPTLVLGAITDSNKLCRELSQYASGLSDKMPEINPKDLHKGIKKWALREEKTLKEAPKVFVDTENHVFNISPASLQPAANVASGFLGGKLEASLSKKAELPASIKTYAKEFREWIKNIEDDFDAASMPLYQGPPLSGSLDMHGYPNVKYVLRGNDGIIQYAGPREEINKVLELNSARHQKFNYKTIKDEGDHIEIEGTWISPNGVKNHFLKPYLVAEGVTSDEEKNSQILSYMFAQNNMLPTMKYGDLHEDVRRLVMEEEEAKLKKQADKKSIPEQAPAGGYSSAKKIVTITPPWGDPSSKEFLTTASGEPLFEEALVNHLRSLFFASKDATSKEKKPAPKS